MGASNEGVMRLVVAVVVVGTLLGVPVGAWAEGGGAGEPLGPELKLGGRVFARVEASSADQYSRTFSLPAARLSLDAKWKGFLKASVEADVASQHPLRDAFVEVDLGRGVELTAGRFKAPFSEWELISAWKLELVNRGLVNDAVTGAGFGGRRIGLQVGWRPEFLGRMARFEAAAFAASGDSNEDLAGRLTVRPLEALTLGVDAYARGGGATAFGADATVRLVGFRLRLEGLRLPVQPESAYPEPLLQGANTFTALLTRRIPLGADLLLEPLAGAEWLDTAGDAPLAHNFVAGLNLLRADAFKAQVQVLDGQLTLNGPRETRVMTQLGARF